MQTYELMRATFERTIRELYPTLFPGQIINLTRHLGSSNLYYMDDVIQHIWVGWRSAYRVNKLWDPMTNPPNNPINKQDN